MIRLCSAWCRLQPAVLAVVLLAALAAPAFAQSPQIQAERVPDRRPPDAGAQTEQPAFRMAAPLDELPEAKPMPIPAYRAPLGLPEPGRRPGGVDMKTGTALVAPTRGPTGATSGRVDGHSGELGSTEIAPSLFSTKNLVSDPSLHPWRMNVKIWMLFTDGWYTCSGSLIGDAHVLTAGHCINKGGTGGTPGEWARRVIVVPAYSDGMEPFGRAGAAELWSWNNWIDNSDFNGDMGWIVLDRSVSVLTGWFGYAWNADDAFFTGNAFQNPGYPAEPPYTGHQMYAWSGAFDDASTDIVTHNADPPLSGGQSGSGAHFTDGTGRWQYAVASFTYVNSSGTRIPPSGYNRMTQAKFNWTAELDNNHRPVALDLEVLDANGTPARPIEGTELSSASVYLYNKSKASRNSSWCFDAYLSIDDVITTADRYTGSYCFSWNFTSRSGVWIQFAVTLPDGVAGTRYLGVLLDSQDANPANNTTHGWDAARLEIRQSHVLTVASASPATNVAIAVEPADVFGSDDGQTDFTRRYRHRTSVTLEAPPSAAGNAFVHWERNGVFLTSSNATTTTLTSDVTLTAVYGSSAAITPVLECVANNGDGTYTALWGYENTTGQTQTIKIGLQNRFAPDPIRRGQPTKFQTGSNARQLAVVFDGSDLTWSVTSDGQTKSVTASSSSPACPTATIQPITPTFQCLTDNRNGTYNAHLGYKNPNPFRVYVPVGTQNTFTSGAADRSQPVLFLKGSRRGILFITFDGTKTAWQLNGSAAPFSSSSKLCQTVTPTLQCVAANTDGTYTARFGHVNPNKHTVYFKKGRPANRFFPKPSTRSGQIDRFARGTVPYSFAVDFDSSAIAWQLDGQRIRVTSESTACTSTMLAVAPSIDLGEGEGSLAVDLLDDVVLDELSDERADEVNEMDGVPESLLDNADSTAEAELPDAVRLEENYPNPFNPSTRIRFTLPQHTEVRLAVYDIVGREVAVLMQGPQGAGTHDVTFEASDLPSGAYFVRLETPAAVLTRPIMLVK